MPAYFLDTSGMVKRYAVEIGSKWVFDLLRLSSGNSIYVVEITGAETVAALARKRKSRHLTAIEAAKAISRFEKHFELRYQKNAVVTDLVKAAMGYADKHELRGYDAVQLAAAIKVETERKAIARLH